MCECYIYVKIYDLIFFLTNVYNVSREMSLGLLRKLHHFRDSIPYCPSQFPLSPQP